MGPGGVVTKKVPNMYIVYSRVQLKAKSRLLASLEKSDAGEATGCNYCGHMLNTQVTHPVPWLPHIADQEQN